MTGYVKQPCNMERGCMVISFECGCHNHSVGAAGPFTCPSLWCKHEYFHTETPEQAIARLSVQNLDKQ